MSLHTPIRGGAPVGRLSELSPVEAGVVILFRDWRGTVERDGPSDIDPLSAAFDDLCRLCVAYGRRPLMRHQPGCDCLGSDEACLANFVATAAEGDREDALLIATLLVRSDFAPCLLGLAENVGLHLRRHALAARRTRQAERGARLH